MIKHLASFINILYIQIYTEGMGPVREMLFTKGQLYLRLRKADPAQVSKDVSSK